MATDQDIIDALIEKTDKDDIIWKFKEGMTRGTFYYDSQLIDDCLFRFRSDDGLTISMSGIGMEFFEVHCSKENMKKLSRSIHMNHNRRAKHNIRMLEYRRRVLECLNTQRMNDMDIPKEEFHDMKIDIIDSLIERTRNKTIKWRFSSDHWWNPLLFNNCEFRVYVNGDVKAKVHNAMNSYIINNSRTANLIDEIKNCMSQDRERGLKFILKQLNKR